MQDVSTEVLDQVRLKQGMRERYLLSVQDIDGNVYDLSSGYTGTLEIRERVGGDLLGGPYDDAGGEIVFYDGTGADEVNVEIILSETDTNAILSDSLRPNGEAKIFGDLEITQTSLGQVIESIRIDFLLIQSGNTT